MAEPNIENVAASVDETIKQIEGGQPLDKPVAEKQTEIYKLDPKTRVPVSKYEGNMWKGRMNAGTKAIAPLISGWEEAEYYYNNAQQNHRSNTMGNKSGTRNYGKDRRDSFSMTENMVYATVNAVIPNVYAKNPSIEVTMTDTRLEPLGVLLKHLGNRLANMKAAPGVNLKPKMRKCILRTEITNESWVLVTWTKREDSADQAREDIARIGQELAEAKDAETIARLEGELLALEESVDLLDPPGPNVKTLRAVDVRVDPNVTEDDFSDANWQMIAVMESTKYLNARFREKKSDREYVSAYAPSHVVDAVEGTTGEGLQKEIDSFKIFNGAQDNPEAYGYADREAYERAKRTKVWYCFDKVKRRYYMYADNDWTWPIWCFNDPYHFPDFFPTEALRWHSDPCNTRTRGEVSHYLDQQDEINTIVDELNRARVSLRDNTLFNSRVMTSKDVEDIILNANKKIKGVAVPEGQKLEDVIMGPPMPNLQYQHLWDKNNAKQAINMLSGVGDAMRGEQFKTNTTNQAIQEYSSISGVRLDEKRDAVEDFIGAIMYKVLFLCMQFMDEKTVRQLTGSQFAEIPWKQMQPDEIRHLIQCRVEGGSTQKPTSAAKKAEALQMGQILGQFGAQNPVVMMLVIKMFQRAFDGFVISHDDWQMLMQAIQASMQAQQEPPDDEAKEEQAVQEMVKQGMPEEEARKRVADQLKKQPVH